MEERANQIIKQVSKDVEALNERLMKYRMGCYFCGAKMGADTVNTACQMNLTKEALCEDGARGDKVPEERHKGNARHFYLKVS